jgi:hypothetical protein
MHTRKEGEANHSQPAPLKEQSHEKIGELWVWALV